MTVSGSTGVYFDNCGFSKVEPGTCVIKVRILYTQSSCCPRQNILLILSLRRQTTACNTEGIKYASASYDELYATLTAYTAAAGDAVR